MNKSMVINKHITSMIELTDNIIKFDARMYYSKLEKLLRNSNVLLVNLMMSYYRHSASDYNHNMDKIAHDITISHEINRFIREYCDLGSD